MDKVSKAVERLKMASDMSLKLYKVPLLICYSGGKDSDTLLRLAQIAGIPYEVLHSHTTVDAPPTVYHVRETLHRLELEGVKCEIDYHKRPDGSRVTMWNLIPRKLMPPTRLVRYCCEVLKEGGGAGRMIATGVRWDESARRKASRGILEAGGKSGLILSNDNDEDRRLFESCKLKGKRSANPIVDWTDEDVWDFIAAEKIPMNPLYEQGWKRVGCIGCPFATTKMRQAEFAAFPGFRNAYILAFSRMLNARKIRGMLDGGMRWGETAEDVFHWWMRDGVLPGQIDLFGGESDG